MAHGGVGRRRATLGVIGALAVAATLVWWLGRGGGGPERAGVPLDADAARKVAATTNVALGLLENQALDECLPMFEALRGMVPAEPLPWRNIAVARTVALGDGTSEPAPEAVAAARGALADLERVEGRSTESLWLASHVARGARDSAAWRDATGRLVERAADDAAAWYERWKSLRGEGEEGGAAADAPAALDRALALDPRNLWLVIEWCRATALDLGGRPPPEVPAGMPESLASRWSAMEPFASSIRIFANVDIRDLLDKAVAAAENGDAAGVAGRLRGLANVMVPQSEADRRAIERHPLEFVLERYPAAFAREAGLDAAAATASIDVSFADGFGPPPSVAGPVIGALLEDFDLDGSPDLLLLSPQRIVVLGRGRDAGAWEEIASAAVPEGAVGLLAADLDLDFDEAKRTATPVRPGTDPPGADPLAEPRAAGCPAADLDLVVWGASGVTVLENRLADPATPRVLRPFEGAGALDAGPVAAATVADLDADGALDIVTGGEGGVRLWRNLGRGVIAPWGDGAAIATGGAVHALCALDWDRDVDVDVMVGGDAGVGCVENLLHGQFRFVPVGAPEPAPSDAPVAGLDVVDADADGGWDLVVAGRSGAALVRSVRGATGVVRVADPPRPIAAGAASGVLAWDHDNDGVSDLALWGDDGLALRRGLADGGFAEPMPLRDGAVAAVDAGDIDRDGDLDLVVAGPGGVKLVENRGGNANHWIDVALEAQQIKGTAMSPSGRVNAHGIGSLLELKCAARYQPRPVRRRTTHFGLGGRAEADVVRVAWINGVPQNVIRPPADTLVCEEQILLGSCPYLYVWDGERFVFATDLLWGAPLGLQAAEGVLMPSREREWLKIDAALRPRGDRYELRVTEELWEAAYFDALRLHVVDHPEDVAVYSNEKVGPASIAGFGIRTVRTPVAPRAARDGRGRDILAEVGSTDGRFADTVLGKRRQGLCDSNTLELEFGPIADPRNATLFLTGWTYPTTVGENVALSHDPVLSTPRPPWISVPDGAGGWREAIPFTGFPGGKTKTIAIDIPGILATEGGTLRVETTMEIRWDAAFLASGEAPCPVRTVAVDVESADLHHRGRSRIEQDDLLGPERFVYDDVSTFPRWPPMRGAFTRYGDVADLVGEEDDRLVVMGAGDEMTLRFPVPPGPPPGWRRDFLLESVGWDKDANLATAEGQTVEPLPFRAMRSYPPAADDEPEDSPRRRAWLRDRQTRFQDEAYWRFIRRWGTDAGTLEGSGRGNEDARGR